MAENKSKQKTKTVEQKLVTKKEEEDDVISRLISYQLDDILIPLFLLLDLVGLTSARSVCRTWHEYLSSIFWETPTASRVLHSRLITRWENELHCRVEVELGGDWCHAQCNLNMRTCSCQIWCLARDSCLVLRVGGKQFQATYRVNQDEEKAVIYEFSRPVHQIKLSMKDNLELDTRNSLDTPCYFKKSPRFMKAKNKKYSFSKCENNENSVIISDIASGTVLKQFIPYTGWGTKHPISHMKCDSHHLALLLGGRVFVYSISRLLSPDSEDNALVLVASRKNQPPVNFMYLKNNILLTVGGNTIVMFDFWNEKISGTSEFFS